MFDHLFAKPTYVSSRVLIRQLSPPSELSWAEISTSRLDRAFRLRVCAVLRAGSLCVHSRIRLLRSKCLVEVVADGSCAAENRKHHHCPCSRWSGCSVKMVPCST